MRNSSGNATIDFQIAGKPATPVVLADAVALLSGVNFGSVEKVIAALDAIGEIAGIDLSTLVRLEDVPLDRVILGSRGDARRADATGAFCRSVAYACTREDVEEVLRLRARFPAPLKFAPKVLMG